VSTTIAPPPTKTMQSDRSYAQFYGEVRQAAIAWFAEQGYLVDERYAHVLASPKDWRHNIILPAVASYIDAEIADAKSGRRCPLALNGQVNNGLSSQAMLFNLVGPLIDRRDLEPLRDAFTEAGIPWPSAASAAFEIEDRAVFNEQNGQPTSIDMVISGNGAPLFIEAKFTEKKFGGCSIFGRGDCDGRNPAADHTLCYLHQHEYRYWQHLGTHGFLAGPSSQGASCVMANDYQFFREILFALHNRGSFVLLHDVRNPLFLGASGALARLTMFVPEDLRDRIKHISVQQIFAAIVASGRHADWTDAFARKYGLQ
jgi:POLQ-like helicase